jgi:uracil-DNA glycosylase
LKIKTYWDLHFFSTGEWQVIEERLKEYEQNSKLGEYNPPRRDLFAALRVVRQDSCRVVIMGQDPYPRREHCTGIAFSVPRGVNPLPPTLVNILKEYQDDLGYPAPKNGDLTNWCKQGVLLWNAIPTCTTGKPASHHWPEWELLTQEIVEKLDGQVVFVFLGRLAGRFARYVQHSPCISTSHPSPLGVGHGFSGSRIFSRTNDLLVGMGKEQINWRLEDDQTSEGNPSETDPHHEAKASGQEDGRTKA